MYGIQVSHVLVIMVRILPASLRRSPNHVIVTYFQFRKLGGKRKYLFEVSSYHTQNYFNADQKFAIIWDNNYHLNQRYNDLIYRIEMGDCIYYMDYNPVGTYTLEEFLYDITFSEFKEICHSLI